MRKMEMGKTRTVSLVMLNSAAIWGMALLQIDEPIVLFMTCKIPAAITRDFFPWWTHQYSLRRLASILLENIPTYRSPVDGVFWVIGPE